jgi:hypothetical protein
VAVPPRTTTPAVSPSPSASANRSDIHCVFSGSFRCANSLKGQVSSSRSIRSHTGCEAPAQSCALPRMISRARRHPADLVSGLRAGRCRSQMAGWQQ